MKIKVEKTITETIDISILYRNKRYEFVCYDFDRKISINVSLYGVSCHTLKDDWIQDAVKNKIDLGGNLTKKEFWERYRKVIHKILESEHEILDQPDYP